MAGLLRLLLCGFHVNAFPQLKAGPAGTQEPAPGSASPVTGSRQSSLLLGAARSGKPQPCIPVPRPPPPTPPAAMAPGWQRGAGARLGRVHLCDCAGSVREAGQPVLRAGWDTQGPLTEMGGLCSAVRAFWNTAPAPSRHRQDRREAGIEGRSCHGPRSAHLGPSADVNQL